MENITNGYLVTPIPGLSLRKFTIIEYWNRLLSVNIEHDEYFLPRERCLKSRIPLKFRPITRLCEGNKDGDRYSNIWDIIKAFSGRWDITEVP